ncbi:MAG: hypothetical protein JJU32_06805 [Phormidium sp. BM_Day4_Bin.17]|nr:hypothetical protein [Phormidium sp. BM_Day4_Bin.17]UCJ11337.1 MAG: hypothetical protein JWS08_16415 [Phormidium sp. PBR-2020]
MSKSIQKRVDDLPTRNLTIFSLNALDNIVPGKWDNLVGWDNTIKTITQESDPAILDLVSRRAIALYDDKSQGYQTALWLYDTIDRTGSALGTAALGNKIGEKIPLLGFLSKLTPKAEKAQTIDLSLKLVVEVVAFCKINGIPGDSLGDFLRSLSDYGGESLMRMSALVCFDGLIPLGPNFIQAVSSRLNGLSPKELEDNSQYKSIKSEIPGKNSDSKLSFIGESFDSVKGWMGDLVSSNDLTPQKVSNGLQGFIDFSEDRLDYLAAFLDMSTDYYRHTGVQTLARRLIERSLAEI